MPFCTQCGAKLEEGAKFCTQCGARLPENTETVFIPPTEEKPAEPQSYSYEPPAAEQTQQRADGRADQPDGGGRGQLALFQRPGDVGGGGGQQQPARDGHERHERVRVDVEGLPRDGIGVGLQRFRQILLRFALRFAAAFAGPEGITDMVDTVRSELRAVGQGGF